MSDGNLGEVMDSSKTIEELLLDVFGGNPYHARAREVQGDTFYTPSDIPLSLDNLAAHLRGEIILGTYQVNKTDNSVKWLGWDIDSRDLKEAREIVSRIVTHLVNIPFAVEFSGSKGYHVLLFLEEPMQASEAKRIAEWVRDSEGLRASGSTHVECYPKQDAITADKQRGSLLKIPLGLHPKTHQKSRFVDMFNGWESGPELSPTEILLYRVSVERVKAICGSEPSAMSQIADLVVPFWKEGTRHDLALYLCGFLANEGWTVDSTRELMGLICDRTGDSEINNREQTIITTFRRYRDGKTIRGRQGLSEMLPSNSMQKLTELSSVIRSPSTILQIDEIRYMRGRSKIEIVRLAANTIWSIMNDNGGKIFQTLNNQILWYNDENNSVTEEGSEFWESILNGRFGLNPIDGFSRMVIAEIKLRAIRESPMIPVRNRTYWDEESGKLYINLGGANVYIVSGEEKIEESFNGRCGQFFLTNSQYSAVVPDFDAPEFDCWKALISDLSFAVTQDSPAKPEEQKELLKAWILSFFFQERMPTKPILAIIGQPGSGKTTAIRRILKVLEGPEQDVLGVPTDKQDAFRSSIEKHRLLVMDNLEKSGAWWMIDMLNKLATGAHIEIRKLYRTNEIHTIFPSCFVALTAINIPFSDETLFSRLLVLEMKKLEDPLPEHQLQKVIIKNAPAIWANLMRKLGIVVDVLKQKKEIRAPTKSRLVDFTVFCETIKDCSVVNGKDLTSGLESMIDSQMKQLKESSVAISLLSEWISLRPDEAKEWKTFIQLYELLQNMAIARRRNFPWRSSQALMRHLSTLEERLRTDFQAEIKFEQNNGSGNTNVISQIRFNSSMYQSL